MCPAGLVRIKIYSNYLLSDSAPELTPALFAEQPQIRIWVIFRLALVTKSIEASRGRLGSSLNSLEYNNSRFGRSPKVKEYFARFGTLKSTLDHDLAGNSILAND